MLATYIFYLSTFCNFVTELKFSFLHTLEILDSRGFIMERNIGDIDKIIRALIGFSALGAGFYFQSWWGIIGLFILMTATFKWCPPYSLLGISTCRSCSTEN